MEATITAVGTAVPFYKYAQQELVEHLAAVLALRPAEKRLFKAVYKATGIDYRYSVLADCNKAPSAFEFFPKNPEALFPSTAARMRLYKASALNLALASIADCLENHVNFNKNSITHIITVSCTGMYAPGIDIEIVQQLQLSSTVQRTAINFMGCYGAFNALKIAHAVCRADPNAKVLVVCVELCTIHFKKSMLPDDVIANAIFADGAAALLIEALPQQKKYLSLEKFHCDLLPQTSEQMAWSIADQGFDIVLSSYVPEAITKGINDIALKLVEQQQEDFLKADLYAIHPGGVRILEACEKALNISKEDNRYAYQILRQYGNMSSPTVLFVLKAIWDGLTNLQHNQKIFSCAFGPGLTFEAMVLKIYYE